VNDNAKRFIQFLKETKESQIFGTLHNKCGYCVLGLACLFYEKETGKKLKKSKNGFYTEVILTNKYAKVRKWLGLKSSSGVFNQNNFDKHDFGSLATLNDNYKIKFPHLAIICEEFSEELFE